MDYTSLFYWLVVADNARLLFAWGVGVFSIITVIAGLVYLVALVEEATNTAKASKVWLLWSLPFSFLWWALLIFTPSKKDSLLIVAGGGTLNYLTTDSTAKQIPRELTHFVVTELKNMAKESEVELNLQSNKEKLLDEAKSMTMEQILERSAKDSLFKKIVFENIIQKK